VQARQGTADGLEFSFLADAANDDKMVVCIDTNAGADVAFCAMDESTKTRVLVLVQAKARKCTSLPDALRSATPAWQYTTAPQRKALETGKWPERALAPSVKLRAWQALSGRPPDLVASAIRVVVSVNPFRDESYQLCTQLLSDSRFEPSPVVLCSSTARAFGTALHDRLAEACDGEPVSHSMNMLYWLPHSVAALAAACAAKAKLTWEP
jgi:hypothetical protein